MVLWFCWSSRRERGKGNNHSDHEAVRDVIHPEKRNVVLFIVFSAEFHVISPNLLLTCGPFELSFWGRNPYPKHPCDGTTKLHDHARIALVTTQSCLFPRFSTSRSWGIQSSCSSGKPWTSQKLGRRAIHGWCTTNRMTMVRLKNEWLLMIGENGWLTLVNNAWLIMATKVYNGYDDQSGFVTMVHDG